mmetsp:Transcript_36308/g.90370  ORF Transcript_36308/g.90370 Transcript_36308/m.90370 type:complete len:220 (+) Transcript_36308:849-1508(+)
MLRLERARSTLSFALNACAAAALSAAACAACRSASSSSSSPPSATRERHAADTAWVAASTAEARDSADSAASGAGGGSAIAEASLARGSNVASVRVTGCDSSSSLTDERVVLHGSSSFPSSLLSASTPLVCGAFVPFLCAPTSLPSMLSTASAASSALDLECASCSASSLVDGWCHCTATSPLFVPPRQVFARVCGNESSARRLGLLRCAGLASSSARS